MSRRFVLVALAAILIAGAGIFLWLHSLGTSPTVRFGSQLWVPVHASDPWVPKPVRLALKPNPPAARPGALAWRRLATGFEVGELPVRAGGSEVDRILLARIDPKRFRFEVKNAPKGDKDLEGWMRSLCPVLVVNGSYYAHDGTPDTPVVSDGKPLGPKSYDGRQGAFVSSGEGTELHDLAQEDWRPLLAHADAAMVSYPLLLAPDGSSRVPRPGRWLANRSFPGEDGRHRILIGTTQGAFFSLDRLADFLKEAPLGLTMALNLDGGPVACQGISYHGFERRQCGRWEIEVDHGQAKMLPTWALMPGHPFGTPVMPMALAVYPRTGHSPCAR